MNDGRSVLTVDLGAVAQNLSIMRAALAPGAQIAGVVKTDAYGVGMEKIWAVLESDGCPLYFVATPEEGLALRRLTRKPIAILGGLFGAAKDLTEGCVHHNLTPVLNSLPEIDAWRAAAQRKKIPLPSILHFDTGMNRLGLGADETEMLLADPARLEGLTVQIVMSHFACADEFGNPKTAEQARSFAAIAAQFPQAKKSLANSSGLFRSKGFHYDLVRTGMALYGLNPLPERDNPLKPAIALESPILQVRNAKKGETVGYGATYRCVKNERLAAVSLGYGDGLFRTLGNRGALYYKGIACPLVGRISMDLATVRIDHGDPQPGEMMEIIGSHQSVDQLAADAGTIGYEILTALGQRYRRIYKS